MDHQQKNEWDFFVPIDDQPKAKSTYITAKYKPSIVFISEKEKLRYYARIRKYNPNRNIVIINNLPKNQTIAEEDYEADNNDNDDKIQEQAEIKSTYTKKIYMYIILTSFAITGLYNMLCCKTQCRLT